MRKNMQHLPPCVKLISIYFIEIEYAILFFLITEQVCSAHIPLPIHLSMGTKATPISKLLRTV